MRRIQIREIIRAALILIAVFSATNSFSATFTIATSEAWNAYIEQSRQELARSLCNPDEFLRIERPEESGKSGKAFEKNRSLTVHPEEGGSIPVPAGLIHHWIGTVFIPNVREADVLATLQDYNAYSDFFPSVIASKLSGRSAQEFSYRLKFAQKGFGVQTGLLGDFVSHYSRLGSGIGFSITEAARLVELDNPGEADEQEVSQSAAHGYIEKMFTIVRYREYDGGVYLKLDAMTLSRDIPPSIRWFVSPVVQRVSRRLMVVTMERVKARVQQTQTFESASVR